MNKKVKIIACVLIVVCVVVAICIGRYLRLKKNEDSKYSFDYIKNMIKEGNDENKYIHVRNEWFQNGKSAAISEVAMSDKKIYMHEDRNSQAVYDVLWDLETSKQYMIYHGEKVIEEIPANAISEDEANVFINQINETAIEFMNREDAKYEFCEMTKVNDDKCVKVAVSSEESGTNETIYFYIRLSDKCVVKMESQENDVKVELVVSYYNDIDSEFIDMFNLDSYADYERKEHEM